MDCYY